jgi:2-keto-3-deoxy-L-rhamnonate aldolase RhmA
LGHFGDPGNTDSPEFGAAIAAIVKVAHQCELTVGIFAASVSAWRDFRDLGCDYVVLGADSIFMADSAARALAEARELQAS